MKTQSHSRRVDVRKIAMTGMLSAVAAVLMFLSFSIPLVPSFLKMDFSELPALIASFAFGPVLVLNGEVQTFPDRKVTYAQRVAIGQIDRLKYVVAVSDGYMQENSTGLTMDQMAQLMAELGAVTAYNLDGGQSSSMIMHNIKMNADSKVMRAVGDILYFVTAIPND